MANRDHSIIRLQADLDTAIQQRSGIQEELALRDDEVSRVQMRLREQQAQMREVQGQLEVAEERIGHGEKSLSQQSHDYQVWNLYCGF